MRVLSFLGLLVTLLACLAHAQDPSASEALITTELGSFRIEFFPDKAPRHVAQFLSEVQNGSYDGTSFFRLWANGLVQGGDPLMKDPATPRARWGTGGFNKLPSEINDQKHERGMVSALNIPGKPHSDGSQFFVCLSPQTALDGKYTVFGHVTEGLDVVEKISRLPVDQNNLAATPVHIVKAALVPKRQEPYANSTPQELRKLVTLNTTLGVIKIQMEPDWAPHTVQRFLMLCATGWYDHTAFHRLAKGFVLQGGTAETRSTGPVHFADRWIHNLPLEAGTHVKHERGIISMAHADDPNSGNTSFFIVLGSAPHLDGNFAAFGKVVQGMEVLDAFEKEDVDGETPKRRLELISAAVEDATPGAPSPEAAK